MAPELIKGQPKDKKSDAFTVGALLYKMLYNKEPY